MTYLGQKFEWLLGTAFAPWSCRRMASYVQMFPSNESLSASRQSLHQSSYTAPVSSSLTIIPKYTHQCRHYLVDRKCRICVFSCIVQKIIQIVRCHSHFPHILTIQILHNVLNTQLSEIHNLNASPSISFQSIVQLQTTHPHVQTISESLAIHFTQNTRSLNFHFCPHLLSAILRNSLLMSSLDDPPVPDGVPFCSLAFFCCLSISFFSSFGSSVVKR